MNGLLSLLKSIYRLLPSSVRERVAYAREWTMTFLNYVFFRRSGAWPHTLYIETTNICNARCVFCAYPQMERPKVTMPMDTFKKAVLQHLELGPGEVDLTPIVGDPMIDKHLFERMDWLCTLPKVKRFHFYTNAILLRPQAVERLLAYDERLMVLCSFGGFDRPTYAKVMGVDKFDEAVAGIRSLVEGKRRTGSAIHVRVNLRIPPGSAKGEFWDYLKAAKEDGVITFDEIDDFDNWGGAITEEALRGAGLVPKPAPVLRGPCRRLLTGPTVLADGRLNACACRDVEATLVIGDINKDSLKNILRGPELNELVTRHERGDLPDVCRVCTRYESVYPNWLQGALFPVARKLLEKQ